MEKEFITFELALKLKQLGFDEPCFSYWSNKYSYSDKIIDPKNFIAEDICESALIQKREITCLAPTLSQAFRWFRDKYDLFTHIEKGESPKNFYPIIDNVSHKYNPKLWFDTYVEAELACLEKLIEIVESKSK